LRMSRLKRVGGGSSGFSDRGYSGCDGLSHISLKRLAFRKITVNLSNTRADEEVDEDSPPESSHRRAA
jgi:hypothetical protein